MCHMSKLLATATQSLWAAIAVRVDSSNEAGDFEYHFKALTHLAQISSVSDLLGGHAKAKEYMNTLKTAAVASRDILRSLKSVVAMMEKDPDAKLRPAVVRAAAAMDKRPKHDTSEDFSLEDSVHKAYVAAYEAVVDLADSCIVTDPVHMNKASTKLESLELDKVETEVKRVEPFIGASTNLTTKGSCWYDGFVEADGSAEIKKKAFIKFFTTTLGKWSDKDTKTHSERYSEAFKVSLFSLLVPYPQDVGTHRIYTDIPDIRSRGPLIYVFWLSLGVSDFR
jgi:hypothetical protein